MATAPGGPKETQTESFSPPGCWNVAEIDVFWRNTNQPWSYKNISIPLFQFMVQKQQNVLQGIVEECGFDFDPENSKLLLTVRNKRFQEEELKEKINTLFKRISRECERSYNSFTFQIDDNVWPCICEKFFGKSKQAFQDGLIQVYKRSDNTYCLVGIASIFKEHSSILGDLNEQHESIKIENMKLFEDLAEVLKLRFKIIDVSAINGFLILYGQKQDVKECAQFCEMLNSEKVSSCTRVVSEYLYLFLKLENVRPEINKYLLSQGHRVDWQPTKGETCNLVCWSSSVDSEKAVDFFINQLVKEILFDEEYLKCRPVNQHLNHMKNGKLVESSLGFPTLLYYGSIYLPTENVENEKFWFRRRVYKPEVLRFLCRPGVQEYFNTKLRFSSQMWGIFPQDQRISVSCQNIAQVEVLVSQIVDQVYIVSKSAKMCQNHHLITQFCQNHPDLVEIKEEKDCWTFYLIADLKDKFENMFEERVKRGIPQGAIVEERESLQDLTKTAKLVLTEEVLQYLKKRCSSALTNIAVTIDVSISIFVATCHLELKAMSENKILKAKENILALLESISCQREKMRIRRDFNISKLGEEVEALEKTAKSCTLTLAKEVKEPKYLDCWIAESFRIVTAAGCLTSIDSDLLICFLDESCEPVGCSAKQIFMTGEWPKLEDIAQKNSKSAQSSKCRFTSSSTTGILKCRQILFVSSRNVQFDIGEIWKRILQEVNDNQWCSICLPVESAQITSGSLDALVSILAKGVSTTLPHNLELQLSIWETNESLKAEIHNICWQLLRKTFFHLDLNVDELGPFHDRETGVHPLIEVKLEIGSYLDVAKELKVDVIVNSTNPKLNLDKGFVSSLISKEGGQELKDEVKKNYKSGIGYGKIAATSGEKIGCREIFHGALYKGGGSQKLSIKVLKCFIKRCLLEMKEKGYKTIAFPALGTGNLCFPYISVARAIKEALTEHGTQHPSTGVETVYIILHETEEQCIQVFKDLFECPVAKPSKDITDILLRPEIIFLESRASANGNLIQLFMEEIDEQVDAVIKISRGEKTSGEVDFTWCSEKECYIMKHSLSSKTEHVKEIVQKCFKVFDDKRISSARIDIKDCDPGMNDALTTSFLKTLNQYEPSSCIINYFLRKFQFIICDQTFQSLMNKQDPNPTSKSRFSWNPFGFAKKDFSKWREVKKKKQRDVVVSVLGPSKQSEQDQMVKVLSDFKKKAALSTTEIGNWCFFDRPQWRFVSRTSNVKLNIAVQEGYSSTTIEEEDGTVYRYNFMKMTRKPKNLGDVLPEKICCLSDIGERTASEKELWYVQQNNKWVLLPKEIRGKLSKAKHANESKIHDEHNNYTYDVKIHTRKQQGKQNAEEIICIEAPQKGNEKENIGAEFSGNKTQMVKQLPNVENVQRDEHKRHAEYENDVHIFESVSGKVSYEDVGDNKNEIKRQLENIGCTVKSNEKNCFQIKGNLLQIQKVSQWLMNGEKETESLVNFMNILMSDREYKMLEHFGTQRKWFKQYWNLLHFDGRALTGEVPINEEKQIREDINRHLEEVKMMTSLNFEVKDASKEIIQEVEKNYPNVCVVLNENIVDVISDSYEDALKVQTLMTAAKKKSRSNRKFALPDDREEPSPSSTANDVYHPGRDNSQTKSKPSFFEMETTEGLSIKVYVDSITRLSVDCIVNAANEHLMHGGGVAYAISDAAGYQFDQESAQYIKDNGPIPVGSCCVTSAGKLPYKHVIHTVGPRWGDYTDKEKCLQDLQKSVRVTFEKADELNMKSIAIPAISSGIFAVPRDMCVEQYYKATMSFSSTHSCQSLKEIHFVDRDESMVRAIQEVFQQKQSSTSSTATSMYKEQFDALEYGKTSEEIDQIKTPFSNGYTVVTVSNTLQIKIYLGNVTDIAADVIVCPQDEFCSSDNPIARGIFSMIGGHKPISGEMGHMPMISQTLDKASPWKMIIHAAFPIYDDRYSKDPTKFGIQFNLIMRKIIEKAEVDRFTSIAIPLLIEGKKGYIAPIESLALNFKRVVEKTAKEINSSLKVIYLVLRDEEDENIYLEILREKYEITPRPVIQTKTLGSNQSFGKTLTNKPEEEETCCICMDTPTNPKRLHKCGHIFCKDCIEQCFSYKPTCPNCGQIYGKMTGDQPPGTISIRKYHQSLSGFYDSKDCIILTYTFQHGRQGDEHPNPGTPYEGIQRSGYVPNNEKGRLVAKLLNVAFSRRLVFTIGRSRTTGKDGVITWNDIHHKTRIYGGPEKFGYPDPTYLDRVLEELAAKGVTPESADDPQEYKEYSKLFKWE